MINAETSTLVFKDGAGEYYLLPQEALERGRVPEEHKAEVERLLATATDAKDGADVQGYFWPILLLGLAGCKAAAVENSSPPVTPDPAPDLSSVLSSSASPETIR